MQKLFNLNINNNNNNNYNNKFFIHLQASNVVQPVLQYGGLYYIYVPEDDCGCTGTRRIKF